MHSPDGAPKAVAAEIAELCRGARIGSAHLYGQLLRENIIDALASTFPQACERLGPSLTENLAAAFLTDHRASLPQFHQIATEFVTFVQARQDLPSGIVPLIEYEWLLLAVEIDTATVAGGRSIAALTHDVLLALNPTARLAVLPFDFTRQDGAVVFETDAGYPYALYRTATHLVVTQPLTQRDCLVLEIFRDADVVAPSALARALRSSIPGPDLRRWLVQAIADGLICPKQPN